MAFCRGPIAATQGGVSLWITEEQISKWPPDVQAGMRFLLKIGDGSEFLTSAAENRSRPRLSKSTPHFRGID